MFDLELFNNFKRVKTDFLYGGALTSFLNTFRIFTLFLYVLKSDVPAILGANYRWLLCASLECCWLFIAVWLFCCVFL